MNAGPTALVIVRPTAASEPHLERSVADAKPAADAAALFLLALLFFLLACFILGAVALARRSRRTPLEESEWQDPAKVKRGPEDDLQTRAEWEQDADWWKKGE